MQDRDRERAMEIGKRRATLEMVCAGRLTQRQAGDALGLSERWVRELLRRYEKRGVGALVHGNLGRESPRRLCDADRQAWGDLYEAKYSQFNLTHFRQTVGREEGKTPPSREWLRQVLMKRGVWERTRNAPRHRQRRPRKAQEGEMLQLDGSKHRWFGEGFPEVTLVGAIDDATGDVPWLRFYPEETSAAYLELLDGVVRRKGIPVSVYTDRDSAFVLNDARAREGLSWAERSVRTQVGRALKELGSVWIPAFSPQAKGRIERLWGTFQDRLVPELQLKGIHTIEEANRYLTHQFLPDHCKRHRVLPRDPRSAYRPSPLPADREAVLCWKEQRTLGRDHTFSLEGRAWQVDPHDRVRALTGRRVEVRRTLRGQLQAWYGPVRLRIRPAPARPVLEASISVALTAASRPPRGRLRF